MKKEISLDTKKLFEGRVDCNKNLKRLEEFVTTKDEDEGSILLCGDRGIGKTTLVRSLQKKLELKNYRFIWIDAFCVDGTTEKQDGISMHHLLKYLTEELDRTTLQNKLALKRIKHKLYLNEKSVGINLGASRSTCEMTAGTSVNEKWLGYTTIELASRIKDFLLPTYLYSARHDFRENYRGVSKNKLIDTLKFVGHRCKSFWHSFLLFIGFENENLVFVFDELDNYESSDQETKTLLKIIKTFKNLFTLSHSKFIFIASTRIFSITNHTTSAYQGIESDKYRTLFSNQLYLKRASMEELKSYIKKTINGGGEELQEKLAQFFVILAYGNIHNLHKEINKYITQNEDSDEHNINVDFLLNERINTLILVSNIADRILKERQTSLNNLLEDVITFAKYKLLNDYWHFLEEGSPSVTFEALANASEGVAKAEISGFLENFFYALSVIMVGNPSGISFKMEDNHINWEPVKEGINNFVDLEKHPDSYVSPDERRFYDLMKEIDIEIKDTFKASTLKDKVLEQQRIITPEEYSAIVLFRDSEIKKNFLSRDSAIIHSALTVAESISERLAKFWRYSDNLLLRNDTPQSVNFLKDEKIIRFEDISSSDPDHVSKVYINKITNEPEIIDFKLEMNFMTGTEGNVFSVLAYDSASYGDIQNDSFYGINFPFGRNNPASVSVFRGIGTGAGGQDLDGSKFAETDKNFRFVLERKGKTLVYYLQKEKRKLTEIYRTEIEVPLYHLVIENTHGSIDIKSIKLTKGSQIKYV